jgi:hypothetical protein
VQGNEELVSESQVQSSRCDLLLLEADSCGTGIVREPRVRGTSVVEAVTRQWLVKTADWKRLKYVL